MGVLTLEGVKLNLGGKPILNDLNIDFWEGHVHAVVGPNGAGKSTLASTIMGLGGYRIDEGKMTFDGESINDWSLDKRAREGITLAWQEPARFEGLTVKDFISASARKNGNGNIEESLAQVGLDPAKYLTRAVDKTLSAGERKKVELASILAMRPRVALLDEPDSGIDIESIERIFDAVRKLKDFGTTVILITHSLAVLDQAEHAFLLCSGQVVDKGNVSRIRKYFERNCMPCDHKNLRKPVQIGDQE